MKKEMKKEIRLIDANALLENLGEEPMVWSYGEAEIQERNDWRRFKACVEAQDTVDAVEVVHGEWEITEDDYYDLVEMKCSVCGESYGFEDYEDDIPKNYHYCPNCGAKMDGERKDNE